MIALRSLTSPIHPFTLFLGFLFVVWFTVPELNARQIDSGSIGGITYSFDAMPDVLPGTRLLEFDGDQGEVSARILNGAHRLIDREIAASAATRAVHWSRDVASHQAYSESVKENRHRFMKYIGVVDRSESYANYSVGFADTHPPVAMERYSDARDPELVAETNLYRIYQVRWPVLNRVHGEGLLIVPNSTPRAHVVALPDADQTPEQLVGLAEGIPPESQFARHLVESGVQVLIPVIIDRTLMDLSGNNEQTRREWLYRQAFHMGRHVIGYEVQKVLAAVDWFMDTVEPGGVAGGVSDGLSGQTAQEGQTAQKGLTRQEGVRGRVNSRGHDGSRGQGGSMVSAGRVPIGVAGYAEGGLLALYAAAVDERIDAALVSCYFESRQQVWEEPLYRNVWGLLSEFGDAELASLVAPRGLVVEHSALLPKLEEATAKPADMDLFTYTGYKGSLKTPLYESVELEFDRIGELVADGFQRRVLVSDREEPVAFGSATALEEFLSMLDSETGSAESTLGSATGSTGSAESNTGSAVSAHGSAEASTVTTMTHLGSVESSQGSTEDNTGSTKIAHGSAGREPASTQNTLTMTDTLPVDRRTSFDPEQRQVRQAREIEDHVQWLLRVSDQARDDFFLHEVMPEWAQIRWTTESVHPYYYPDRFIEMGKSYRTLFRDEILGAFDDPLLASNPQTVKTYDEPRWTGYEVAMDVLEDLEVAGVLLLPKSLEEGEQRPVVVLQHGRNGLPEHVIEGSTSYYNMAALLADQGFVVFVPYGLYRGEDRYRWLDRKANTAKKTLFSFAIAQHDQLLRWLGDLSFVDRDRIAFYGKSYGGEMAMRIPAVLERYSLSIVSADFGDWSRKVVDTTFPRSFMNSIEWEMPYFNMGSTFSYAEMAYLIFPRPFMVERGRHDLVQPDHWVASEYAKVEHLYTQFNMADRTEIEFFQGGHASRNEGTIRFLRKHLGW